MIDERKIRQARELFERLEGSNGVESIDLLAMRNLRILEAMQRV